MSSDICVSMDRLLFQKGTKAPQAAGKIHTDFEKGFIMAEVMKFDDFKNEGSEAAVKVSTVIKQTADFCTFIGNLKVRNCVERNA